MTGARRGERPTGLKIYDTLRRKKVFFRPRNKNHIRIYVCGPTVYDYAHIGNARPVVVFDVLYRLLKRLYPRVTYVRNITDVDDKINAAAKKSGEPIQLITQRTIKAFHEDMAALGTLIPDEEPRATDHISAMIKLVKKLLAKGHAYEANDHVLFRVQSMPKYGKLSKLSRPELLEGARVEVAPYKEDPADFVLWKPSTPDLPGWDSPWGRSPKNPTGRGRPGWHLECSAMSEKLLGKSFDIHGGGQDLIFPHHENEIAQSTCVNGPRSFAKYWMHNGYLMAEGEKMSKSLGNFYTVRDLLKTNRGEAIRLVLLKTHYRKPLDFTKVGIKDAKRDLDKLYKPLWVAKEAGIKLKPAKKFPIQVLGALRDDLNTPLSISYLHDMASELNMANMMGRIAQQNHVSAKLLAAGEVLGLLQGDPEDWFKRPRIIETEVAAASTYPIFGVVHILSDEDIDAKKAERTAARENRDFKRADEIRKELDAQGIVLEDLPDGTTEWRRK